MFSFVGEDEHIQLGGEVGEKRKKKKEKKQGGGKREERRKEREETERRGMEARWIHR